MFDSPPTSWFSILFPSTLFVKSCGLPPEGKRIEDQEKQQARRRQMLQNGRARPPGLSSGTIHQFRSVSSPVLLGGGLWTWPGCDGLAPWASTASQHTTQNSLKKTMFTVCFSHREARQRPTSSVFFGVLYAYIYEYEYIVRMCTNVVVFFFKISSEKYARYYFDLSSSLYFALIGFFLLYFVLHLKLFIANAQYIVALLLLKQKKWGRMKIP